MALFISFYGMSNIAKARQQLPLATLGVIQTLGADLAVTRLHCEEFLRTWTKRLGVTVSTLQRLEALDPGAGIGIVASGP